jgi:hypothetical protein
VSEETPFQRYLSSDGRQERFQQYEESYEAACVAFFLELFKFSAKEKRALRDLYVKRTGRVPILKFSIFNDEYPTFPVLLGARRIDKLQADPTAFLPALFRNFRQATFVTVYDAFFEANESRAAGKPIGLVFPRKGIPHGLIVHNAEALDSVIHHGTVLVHHSGTAQHVHRVFVQPFQIFCEGLYRKGHGWKP